MSVIIEHEIGNEAHFRLRLPKGVHLIGTEERPGVLFAPEYVLVMVADHEEREGEEITFLKIGPMHYFDYGALEYLGKCGNSLYLWASRTRQPIPRQVGP